MHCPVSCACIKSGVCSSEAEIKNKRVKSLESRTIDVTESLHLREKKVPDQSDQPSLYISQQFIPDVMATSGGQK